jgi:hypothetical protein
MGLLRQFSSVPASCRRLVVWAGGFKHVRLLARLAPGG